ncbi:hypothetical protein CN094_16635 [Sinorhizobium meliloti]|nr:hypothetical protein CN101_10180 [Sinorhizobium meliloti]RVO60140.1 hypothetical protein CN094_16635 [Sinorhizobium meliloti]
MAPPCVTIALGTRLILPTAVRIGACSCSRKGAGSPHLADLPPCGGDARQGRGGCSSPFPIRLRPLGFANPAQTTNPPKPPGLGGFSSFPRINYPYRPPRRGNAPVLFPAPPGRGCGR